MDQLNNDINLLMENNVDFNIWNKIYDKFIEFSQCGRLTLIEIKQCINVLLKSTVICKTLPEEKILKLQKNKLNLLDEYQYKEFGTSVDSIRRIKEYKSYLAMPIINYEMDDTRYTR